VVNAAGGISTRATPGGELTQRLLLEKEGIRLDGKGRVRLDQLRWTPRKRAPAGR
jgi:methylated-DNA-protein-cysteine methyltransferase-like protein